MRTDLGHVYHRCHDIDEWDSHPKEGLDYQPDYRNETYYSIYTQEEMDDLLRDVRITGRFDLPHLYHMDDSWSHVVEKLLNIELVDKDDDAQFLARLHCTYFGNPQIGELLGLKALQNRTVKQVLKSLQNRYEDDDQDDYDDYKRVLIKLKDKQLKEQFRDKLINTLAPKQSTRAVKI